ncbi:proline-rich protein PRCC [Silurus meridionalis]|nr:proline-rich protein PRCC [Silurus meridionalis]
MSLVAYDSSDDSERDDPSPAPRSSNKAGGMFASLPAPKRPEPAMGNPVPGLELPRAKKRSEPVRISAPEIRADSSDEDEEEPMRKKVGSQGAGGLSALLPQPKHLSVKEMQRPLVPHTLTKRPAPAAHNKSSRSASQGVSAASPSPSAIKAAAKSASLQFARQMAADEEGSDDELVAENFFSLSENSAEPEVGASYPDPQPYTPSLQPSPCAEDAPLDFTSSTDTQSRPTWGTNEYPTPEYLPQNHKQADQELYSAGFYQEQNCEQEEAESSTLFNDEAFRRLQGKQNRGKEEIKFLEIKGDDQLSGHQQWMMKNMTTEMEPRRSFSKKKGDQPTGQQRRKHQITYLIHQAKERELELKNSWSENKLTRRQTQAKYGF